jgi:predicted phosphodiesterase
MRILMAGDIHGETEHGRTLVRMAKKRGCDLVFALGDFGYWEHQPDGVKYLDSLNMACNVNNIPMYFLDGNHDKTSLLLEKYDTPELVDKEGFMLVRPYIRYARRGLRWTWDDCRFIALGGAYSVDKEYRLRLEAQGGLNQYARHQQYRPGDLWFPEEEMTDEDMDDILQADVTPVDIMLAHDKPRASNPQWNRKDIPECWPNADRLQRAVCVLEPKLYLHGHLHFRYTDDIAYAGLDGEMRVTHVTGLDCNPDADHTADYVPAHSWWVLDTNDWTGPRDEG